MRIFYLSRVNLLTKKAHLRNIIKTCEFLPAVLVTSFGNLSQSEREDLFRQHRVSRAFPIITLGGYVQRLQWSCFRPLNWLGVLLENFSLIKFLFSRRKKIDVIYFRDCYLIPAVIFGKYVLRKPVFFEAHAAERKKSTQALINLSARISHGVVAISFALKRHYQKLNQNIEVAYCWAPEEENFPYHKTKEELRKELNLPRDKIIIGYTGRLDLFGVHSNYEIGQVIEALNLLPSNVYFLIIGATEKEAQHLAAGPKVEIRPRLPYSEIPSYLLACDILVIPKLGDRPGDSPAKMFEYLAAARPIVAAKTEPVCEVLRHEQTALLVYPNTPQEWAKSIQRLIEDKSLSHKLSQKAFEDSSKYAWKKRAEIISNFIQTRL